MKLTYNELKERHRKIRDTHPSDVKLKIHRALSWLDATKKQEQEDTKFISLWIAFNSIYSQEFNSLSTDTERNIYRTFLSKLISFDKENLIQKIIWENFSGKFRVFIDNKYVFHYFWDFINEKISEQEWEERFERDKKKASTALAKQDTALFLQILFDRLYILRNQLIHGGATFKSDINRSQIQDGCHILEQIVPLIIHIVMENPTVNWGRPSYLPVDQ